MMDIPSDPDLKFVILTGAGISRESGLATFRDADGIWAKHRIEDVATPEAFTRDPQRVLDFYNARRSQMAGIKPNAAHYALTKLQYARPGNVTIVTQNIDGLHEAAGATDVINMHGVLARTRCNACATISEFAGSLDARMSCDACGAIGTLRPDVVWFGEMPYKMDLIESRLSAVDVFVSIGTSGNVYPAAGFVAAANAVGAHTIELNLEPSSGSGLFDECYQGPASETVPAFVDRLT
ncbi:MAG: NAD-dependent deacylase [Pseudomonadota bacterium]